MDFRDESTEKLVLIYLKMRGKTEIELIGDIEIDCAHWWKHRGINRAGSTYRRAFHYLLADGRLGPYAVKSKTFGHGRRTRTCRVVKLRNRVNNGRVRKYKPIQH